MNDQATALRGLMERRLSPPAFGEAAPADRRAFAVAVTSGKGGVGKSNIALNLAIELSRLDVRRDRLQRVAASHPSVCLLDANPGLGNIDLLCGLNGYWNLSHVVSGARALRDVVLAGPERIAVIPGASGLGGLAECPPAAQREVLRQLEELEQSHDFLVLDAGTSLHAPVRQLVAAADLVLVVTTPEPTAIADAYATIKSLSPAAPARIEALVNQCESAALAQAIAERLSQTSRLFVRVDVHSAGWIPRDDEVSRAVARRTPLALAAPQCAAAQAIRQVARRLKTLAGARPPSGPFFANLSRGLLQPAA